VAARILLSRSLLSAYRSDTTNMGHLPACRKRVTCSAKLPPGLIPCQGDNNATLINSLGIYKADLAGINDGTRLGGIWTGYVGICPLLFNPVYPPFSHTNRNAASTPFW
jgi:hypothetical protein